MAVEEECTCPDVAEREEWIYTYGDMVTLLMCFFILLFAMSKSEEELFKAISASFKGGPPGSPFQFAGMPTFMESLEAAMSKSPIAEVADITVDDRGITVSFSEAVFFERGTAQISPGGAEVIEKFSRIMHAIPNAMVVEGHTDDLPTQSETFPSNWELSSARAGSVARLLQEFGIQKNRLEVAGYADTRPKVANETASLRRLNRRIDILVKPDGY
ncbi:MAG: flagellar motor protein MotB [bacterium]|nr:flagellar motor protein MotB [bacterium]